MCLTVKPVGEPDAGDRHVRFDVLATKGAAFIDCC